MKLHQALEFETVHGLKQLRGLIPLTDRSTRKDDIIKAIASYLLSADLRRERIRDFLQTSTDGYLPPQVVQLLDTVAERATALSDAGAARLIKCKDKAIAVMLASDPATAAHCVRAGDRLICVAEHKLKAFRKGLARLGFVLPESFDA